MARSKADVAEQTQAVNACWEQLRTLPLVEQMWPTQDAIPAREVLLRWAPEIHEKLTTKHTLIHRFGVVPIAAVVGLLNSGKSSLTASFLSQANRDRVLRGVGQCEGSQRFTLWVPQTWKDDEPFFEKLLELLTRVFETEPELLADDDAAARLQQNDVDQLARPLIGTDTSLSELRIAILDCPDIQRAKQAEASSTRLEVVQRAAEICAAVFVVFARSQVEIRSLQLILEAMPDAQRIHVVNLIKNDSAEQVREEVAEVLALRQEALVYGAYDFLSAHYEKRTPTWDPNLPRTPQERLEVSSPCFFELQSESHMNTPGAIKEARSVQALASTLTPHAVRSRRMQELIREFYADLQGGVDHVENRLTKQSKSLKEASLKLRDMCQELLSEGGRVRISMSPEILHSVEQSLTRTAPRAYKWLLLPARRFFQTCEGLLEKARKLSFFPAKELREKKAALQDSWQRKTDRKINAGRIAPGDVQHRLSLWSGATDDYQPSKRWADEAEEILARFRAEDRTDLTRSEWDDLTAKLWKQLPMKARVGLATSAVLMLAGLLLVFVDGGISLVMLDGLGLTSMIASLGLSLQGRREFQEVLDQKLGLRQVSNFHAIVCDVIGLPRDDENGPLPAPTVETKLNMPSYGIRDRDWSLHRLNSDSLNALRTHGH